MILQIIGYAILAAVVVTVAGVALRARARRLRPPEPLPRVIVEQRVFLPHATVTAADDGTVTVTGVPPGTPGARGFMAVLKPAESADTKASAAWHPNDGPPRSAEGWSPIGFTTGPIEFSYVDHDALRDMFGRTEQERNGND